MIERQRKSTDASEKQINQNICMELQTKSSRVLSKYVVYASLHCRFIFHG